MTDPTAQIISTEVVTRNQASRHTHDRPSLVRGELLTMGDGAKWFHPYSGDSKPVQEVYAYTNPWYKPNEPRELHKKGCATVHNDPYFNTPEKPIYYKGFEIFERVKHTTWDACVCDVVKDGSAVMQRVTVASCKKWIDGEES